MIDQNKFAELVAARDAAYAAHGNCDPDEPIPAAILAACDAADDALRAVCPHRIWHRAGRVSELGTSLSCECCGLKIDHLSRWCFVLDKPSTDWSVGDFAVVNGEGDDIYVVAKIDGKYAWFDRVCDNYPAGWKALNSARKWPGRSNGMLIKE